MLWFFDPAGGRYLLTYVEQEALRLIAEAQRDAAEERARLLEEELRRPRP